MMKFFATILLLFFCKFSFSQNSVNLSAIDWAVQSIDAPTTEALAKKLTENYKTDLEKTRAIYSWIASHISYNMGIYSWRNPKHVKSYSDVDTALIWKSPDEMVADRVLKRRVAICDGYARLFKTLCEYAGIKSELVLGYVQVPGTKSSFKTNHTWNAVMLDSLWHLVDVTWGSGFVSYANEFVQKPDDYYFLTPPRQLIQDHYPEDVRWALVDEIPVMNEFKTSPFKTKNFVKYGIVSMFPSTGTIETKIGDTVTLELRLHDAEKAAKIASSNYTDSLPKSAESIAILEPKMQRGKRVMYRYIVSSARVQWLSLAYNKDVILQYRLNVAVPDK